jgi:hypothetical protein
VYDSWEPFAGAGRTLAVVLPLALWCVWWLLCVDWKKLWPVLGLGGWAPAVLLVLMAGAAWARLCPGDLAWSGYSLPAPAWQFGAAVGLACLAMICGWLQGVIGWKPPEFPVHPPAGEHGHAHAHGHVHH